MMPPELLAHIDRALTEAMSEPAGDQMEDALIGLVGIRRGLFSDAPAYQPKVTDASSSRGVAA
jgi:hypothetical protein